MKPSDALREIQIVVNAPSEPGVTAESILAWIHSTVEAALASPAPSATVGAFPIATAPRDGTVIRLLWGRDGIDGDSPGWWSAPVSPLPNYGGGFPSIGGMPWSFIDRNGERAFVNTAADTEYGPTHWLPYAALQHPAAPSVSPAVEGDDVDYVCSALGNLFAGDKLDDADAAIIDRARLLIRRLATPEQPDLRESLWQIVRITEKMDPASCEDCYSAACIANGALARSAAPMDKVPGCGDCAHNGRYLCDTHGEQPGSAVQGEAVAWALEQGGILADWCNVAGDALRSLLDAYERRVRSSCTTEADLASEPWRCSEYVQAEQALKTKPSPSVEITTPPPAPAADPFQVPKLPGNWPEDASHENGNYECKCWTCGMPFYGHKRRVVCKVCASTEAPAAEQGDALAEQYRKGWEAGHATAHRIRNALATQPEARGVEGMVLVPRELLEDVEDQLVDLSNEKSTNHGIYREREKLHDADVLQRVRLLLAAAPSGVRVDARMIEVATNAYCKAWCESVQRARGGFADFDDVEDRHHAREGVIAALTAALSANEVSRG